MVFMVFAPKLSSFGFGFLSVSIEVRRLAFRPHPGLLPAGEGGSCCCTPSTFNASFGIKSTASFGALLRLLVVALDAADIGQGTGVLSGGAGADAAGGGIGCVIHQGTALDADDIDIGLGVLAVGVGLDIAHAGGGVVVAVDLHHEAVGESRGGEGQGESGEKGGADCGHGVNSRILFKGLGEVLRPPREFVRDKKRVGLSRQ